MNNKINNLVDKYLLSRKRCSEQKTLIRRAEKKLNIIFPKDFIYFLDHCADAILGNIYFYNFEPNLTEDIVSKNLAYRKKINLPLCYIVLYEEAGGIIIMETQKDSNKSTPIIYCNIHDIFNLIKNKPFNQPANSFLSFTDFFEYLLDHDEAESKSDNTCDKEFLFETRK